MKFNTKQTEEKMQKSIAAYESNLSTIRYRVQGDL